MFRIIDPIFVDQRELTVEVDAESITRNLRSLGYAPTLTDEACQDMELDCPEFADILKRYQAFHQLERTGEIDVPTLHEMTAPRCGLPDLPAGERTLLPVGTGPFRRCHGAEDHHEVNVHWTNSPPAHLQRPYGDTGRTIFQEILRRCVIETARVGLVLRFTGAGTGRAQQMDRPTMTGTFVGPRSWIGLATVGSPSEQCNSSRLWSQYVASFAGNSNVETMIHVWTLLILHEIGHCLGMLHRLWGIMRATLHTSTPARWIGDHAEPWMRASFGGDQAPLPPEIEDRPDPPPPDPPPDPDVEIWLEGVTIVRKGQKELRRFAFRPV